jgi:hypothetical protein
MISPFVSATICPCYVRYISEISKNGENMKFMKTILLSTTLACSGLVQAGDKDVKEELLNKLTFLYSCKAASYDFQCLNKKGMMKKSCVEFGVSGCGNKFIYTVMGKTWILTSSNMTNMDSAEITSASIQGPSPQVAATSQANMAAHQSAMAANQAAMAASQAASQAAMAASQAAMAATPPPQ